MTESYFVSCTAQAEMSMRLSVSAVGNVDVPAADYNIITPHTLVIVWPVSFKVLLSPHS